MVTHVRWLLMPGRRSYDVSRTPSGWKVYEVLLRDGGFRIMREVDEFGGMISAYKRAISLERNLGL